MKYNLRLFIVFLILIYNNPGFTQELQNLKIQLDDAPVEEKLSYSVERIDVNICMGIAYAKSLGKTVEDFAEHVGTKDNLTGRNDTSIEKVVQSIHFVITCYPNGEFEILSQSDSSVEMQWNKPYSDYFKRAALHGVSLDEFETYLYRHVEIMANKIGYNFDYIINSDHVIATLSSIPNLDLKDLIGTWQIIDFEIISNEMSDKINKDKIKEDGLVWDLYLMENGKFKQSSNMSETGTMDSQEGGWRAWDENLTISLQMYGRKIDMNYTYDLKENILVLMRSNPIGTMKIISQFKKK
jgi:hypothetical protein